jgi:hypothetical protein
MRLRIPGWLRSSPTVRLNGRALDASASPGSYLTLQRVWKSGDRIDLDLTMRLYAEALPDNPRLRAFLYGPLVLAGDFGGEGLTTDHIIGPNLRVGAANVEQYGSPLGPPSTAGPVPDLVVPTFRATGDDPAAWIKPGNRPLMFRTSGQRRDVTLVPLNSLFDRRYAVYWEVE